MSKWRTQEVKASHYSIRRHEFVILNKGYLVTKNRCHLLVKLSLRERLKDVATDIFEYPRLYVNGQN